jgi:hypothetical protein
VRPSLEIKIITANMLAFPAADYKDHGESAASAASMSEYFQIVVLVASLLSSTGVLDLFQSGRL